MKITDLLQEAPIDMTGDPNDPMIYGHQKANPMTLKSRIMQARNQLRELADMAESDELVVWERITKLAKGGMFMGLEQNLEQIRHGIAELAAKRRKGGVASRGIDKNISEFATGDDGEEDTLRKFARMWYNGDDAVQQKVERVLDRIGWEIGEIESEEGGAFVVRSGDEHGRSYISFAPEDLSESIVNEKWSQKYKRSINCNNPKGFSQRAHCQGKKK